MRHEPGWPSHGAYAGRSPPAIDEHAAMARRRQETIRTLDIGFNSGPHNALPFSCKPAAEPAPRFYTMSLRRDCQLQRVRQRLSPAYLLHDTRVGVATSESSENGRLTSDLRFLEDGRDCIE